MSLLKQLSRAVQALNRNRVLRSIKAITALLHHIAKSEIPRSQHRCMYPQRHQPAMTKVRLPTHSTTKTRRCLRLRKARTRNNQKHRARNKPSPRHQCRQLRLHRQRRQRQLRRQRRAKPPSLSSRLPTVLQRVISHNPNIHARPANAHMDRPDFAPHHPPQLRRL